MKRRTGFVLLGFITLALLKLISISFGLINLPSDLAVLGGVSILAVIILFSPLLYHYIWSKLINISFFKENSSNED